MNIETKQNNLLQTIRSISDENILEQIREKILKIIQTQNGKKSSENKIERYETKIVEKLDLELIKKEQNYKSPSLEEIEKLIREADIQEPIE